MGRDFNSLVTEEDVQSYQERGFWTGPVIFTPEEVEALRAAQERTWRGDFDHYRISRANIHASSSEPTKLHQAIDASWLNDVVRKAVTSPVLGYIASRLIPADGVRLWHDQMLMKPPRGAGSTDNSGNIGWHQDYAYSRILSTQNLCTAWIALQDTTVKNGAMRMIVGSHKWGFIEGSNKFPSGDLEQVKAFYGRPDEWIEMPCELKAGAVSFHHGLVLHGSGPNDSDSPRMSIAAHYMPDGARYLASGGWDSNVMLLGPSSFDGQPFTGDCWPLVWAKEMSRSND